MSKTAHETGVKAASDWWSTSIIDVQRGAIGIRGYAIEDLIGRITFPEMIWLMLKGDLPSKAQAKLLEAAMVPCVDHGPQAPSCAIARMAVTCGVPVNGALASAINTLDDIHGGPAQRCMEIYNEIDQEAGADGDLIVATTRVLARSEKYMPGFGHRWHPVDPRVSPLFTLVDQAVADGIVSGRFAAIGRAVEIVLREKKGKTIPMN